ncbi:TetR/AcrR family transcriptional regulator [Denitrobaculum tricleocarpae]|uniref:TetR/AcrR family transcriptional regulator n=1 Tax=Denitrobaculum tricleocarpae TaxID=2591009 RepID=A0A545TF05_9PROT|nr:TetR/AcrR family transcriptional regulator [Denitrobaculum tricleocarpae]TQV75822.1 TetR/AcrR family transcriptional regulator [Denitrobaculum tricleocarpae]
MAETATQILDTAEALIQVKGFHAFSFQEVADRVGIKKASIYYHFPAKAELGKAIVARYRQTMLAAMTDLEIPKRDSREEVDYWAALARYLEPILTLASNPVHACLCGILSGEYPGLPKDMQDEVEKFFDEQLTWLTKLLKAGRKAGAFHFQGSPARMAKLSFSAIEGAMLIKRITGDDKHVNQVTESLQALLRG